MNKELQQNLARATQYFQITGEIADRIIEKENHIEYLKTKFQEDKNRGEKPSYILFILGCIGAVFIGFVLIASFIAFYITLPKETRLSNMEKLSLAVKIINLPLFGFLISVFLLFFSKVLKKKNEEKFKKIMETTVQPQIDEAQKEHTELGSTFKNFVDENFHVIEFLPMQYRDLQANSFMFLAVTNGRADSLKEAINLYEEQLHRWKLEEAAQQAAEAQEYMALAMNELNERQAETNAHLRSIEFMQYMQYLNSKSND